MSPYSVTFTLSMIYAGAQGATATEMADVLHAADVPGWQEGINAYDLTLDARTVGSPTTWSAANKVWTQPGLALHDDYLDVLTGVYGSPLAEANFDTDADGERQVINGWVEKHTNDLIPELFPEGSLRTASTAMVLVNAVALDAPWGIPVRSGHDEGRGVHACGWIDGEHHDDALRRVLALGVDRGISGG